MAASLIAKRSEPGERLRAHDGPARTWTQFWHKRARQGLPKIEGGFERSLGLDGVGKNRTTPEQQTRVRPVQWGQQQFYQNQPDNAQLWVFQLEMNLRKLTIPVMDRKGRK